MDVYGVGISGQLRGTDGCVNPKEPISMLRSPRGATGSGCLGRCLIGLLARLVGTVVARLCFPRILGFSWALVFLPSMPKMPKRIPGQKLLERNLVEVS